MDKDCSIGIRVIEEELDELEQVTRLELHASYSGFVGRVALLEASRIIKK